MAGTERERGDGSATRARRLWKKARGPAADPYEFGRFRIGRRERTIDEPMAYPDEVREETLERAEADGWTVVLAVTVWEHLPEYHEPKSYTRTHPGLVPYLVVDRGDGRLLAEQKDGTVFVSRDGGRTFVRVLPRERRRAVVDPRAWEWLPVG